MPAETPDQISQRGPSRLRRAVDRISQSHKDGYLKENATDFMLDSLPTGIRRVVETAINYPFGWHPIEGTRHFILDKVVPIEWEYGVMTKGNTPFRRLIHSLLGDGTRFYDNY